MAKHDEDKDKTNRPAGTEVPDEDIERADERKEEVSTSHTEGRNIRKIISVEGRKRRVVVEGDESVVHGTTSAISTFVTSIIRAIRGPQQHEAAEERREEIREASENATRDFISAIITVAILLTFALTAYIFLVLLLTNVVTAAFGTTIGFIIMAVLFIVLTAISAGVVYYLFTSGTRQARQGISTAREAMTPTGIATGAAFGAAEGAARGAIEGATGG